MMKYLKINRKHRLHLQQIIYATFIEFELNKRVYIKNISSQAISQSSKGFISSSHIINILVPQNPFDN